jgi:hypothetical protein
MRGEIEWFVDFVSLCPTVKLIESFGKLMEFWEVGFEGIA